MRSQRCAGWDALCARLAAVMALCDTCWVLTKEWETITLFVFSSSLVTRPLSSPLGPWPPFKHFRDSAREL